MVGYLNYLILRQIKTELKSNFIAMYSKLSYGADFQSKIFVVITIDTEQDVNEDYVNQGTYANIEYGLPKVLEIFNKYNCKGTFFVTPDAILQNSNFFSHLKDEHEIGCHLHPEFFTSASLNEIKHREYLCNFPLYEQERMIEKSSKIIEKEIGLKPISFRAGRFGINSKTIDILVKNGYLVDSSCTPYISWNSDGGPNWLNCPKNEPFPIHNNFVEVPITIMNLLGIKYWLRPSVSDITTMKKMVEIGRKQKIRVLNLMFHSMESTDPNPYLKSDLFLDRLDEILNYLFSINCKFVTLSDLYDIIRKNGGQ